MPVSVWLSLALFAVGIFVLGYTRRGRALYAIGGNAAAAKAAGIRTDRVIWWTLILVRRARRARRPHVQRAPGLGCRRAGERLHLHRSSPPP